MIGTFVYDESTMAEMAITDAPMAAMVMDDGISASMMFSTGYVARVVLPDLPLTDAGFLTNELGAFLIDEETGAPLIVDR